MRAKHPGRVCCSVSAAAFPSAEPVSIKCSIKIPSLVSCLVQLAEKRFFFSQQNERLRSFSTGSVKLLAVPRKPALVRWCLETDGPWSRGEIRCHDGAACSQVFLHPTFPVLSFPLPRLPGGHCFVLFCFKMHTLFVYLAVSRTVSNIHKISRGV